jgi:cobalt-zinc-cadmium efflux system protein
MNHEAGTSTDQRRLLVALCLIATFMLGEVVVGTLAHSLALLSDAAHMLTDVGAIGLSLVALRLAARPPAGGMTFGLKRAEILAALLNGATLFLLAGVLVYEATRRLVTPPTVEGAAVIGTAAAGIVVNLVATWQLAGANRRSLNVQGSFRHIVTDLYAFAGTLIAGIVIVVTGFNRADAAASLVVAGLMLHAGSGLLWKAGRVLLDAAPADLDPEQIGRALVDHPHVVEVHDLHVWEVTSGFPALSAHVLVHPKDDCHAIRLELERLLEERFGVEHTTLQVDHAQPEFLQVRRIPNDGERIPPPPPPHVPGGGAASADARSLS